MNHPSGVQVSNGGNQSSTKEIECNFEEVGTHSLRVLSDLVLYVENESERGCGEQIGPLPRNPD